MSMFRFLGVWEYAILFISFVQFARVVVPSLDENTPCKEERRMRSPKKQDKCKKTRRRMVDRIYWNSCSQCLRNTAADIFAGWCVPCIKKARMKQLPVPAEVSRLHAKRLLSQRKASEKRRFAALFVLHGWCFCEGRLCVSGQVAQGALNLSIRPRSNFRLIYFWLCVPWKSDLN